MLGTALSDYHPLLAMGRKKGESVGIEGDKIAYILRDLTVGHAETAIDSACRRPPKGWEVRDCKAELGSGEVFDDVVRPNLEQADLVVAFVDEPNANVAFELGYVRGLLATAVGPGRFALAVGRTSAPDWARDAPPYSGLGIKSVRNGDELRDLISSGGGVAYSEGPTHAGDRTLFSAPSKGFGSDYRGHAEEVARDWVHPSSSGWNLKSIHRQFDGIGRVVWVISECDPDESSRDGIANIQGAALAGFARALGLDIQVLGSNKARRIADLAGEVRVFHNLEEFEGLLRSLEGVSRVQPSRPARLNPVDRMPGQLESLIQDYERRRAKGEDARELAAQIRAEKRKLRQAPTLQPNYVIGRDDRYALEEVIGSGGFAQVWRAWDRRRSQFVALKVLHGQHASDKSRVRRFLSGARKQQRLNHPNIVRVLDIEPDDESGWVFFAMELIEGTDLKAAVTEGTVGREDSLAALEDVANALGYANRDFGIVHRDIKPANILIDRNGRAHLSDFDLVHAPESSLGTMVGQSMGTFDFGAPEVLNGDESTSHASDVYSLGMTLLWTLSRGKPIRRGTGGQIEIAFRAANLSPPAEEAIRASLSDRPDARPASAEDLLAAVLNGERGAEGGARKAEVETPRFSRRTALVGLASVGAIGLSIVGAKLAKGGSDDLDSIQRPFVEGEWDGVDLARLLNRLRQSGVEDESLRGKVLDQVAADVATEDLGQRMYALEVSGVGVDREAFFRRCGRWPSSGAPNPPTMVRVPPSGDTTVSFQMGSPDGIGYSDERPQRQVTLSAYAIAEAPTTEAEFARFDRARGAVGSKLPVAGVSWWEAWLYARWVGGRLPTEAEWECAARAGTNGLWSHGNDEAELGVYAWFSGNSESRRHDVGTRKANPWGLHDMHGNVWEWCMDWFGEYDGAETEDPSGPAAGARRVLRGGSSWYGAAGCRSAFRLWYWPWWRIGLVGFRVVLPSS
ncbi:bifunctional serine/threonine-protein kinase/formylglycine-generating enzyme family protein [Engelhardtia mirabilis]|uniref:Serine/threonine-protein kinase PK-1 n=1 Tax=Engelhardtia mirabilis TaxID=2528011 RepID=A0A518BFZ5_9BACT|nr:Serine/threonine-protein kinase PK-1 [Planctomycetes bacterium Pla133]QDV00227.1 Serine/threonine-protein kinase PK-1 [Planctomycetes bacterium Pla86]